MSLQNWNFRKNFLSSRGLKCHTGKRRMGSEKMLILEDANLAYAQRKSGDYFTGIMG